ncbi:cold-shock protein [Photobacterium kishitanii]|uniref:cold-shock protein n=1 Tax=Photobacterium kishitanii TaxID=318456 RepID=UPI00071AEE2C|nr:cold shock domain-containing protein [Photobacterium kishitanii]
MEGTVVSYLKNKKYGFVLGDDGESYFLHYSSLNNKHDEDFLIKNVKVSFDQKPTPKGLAAIKVDIYPSLTAMKMLPFFMIHTSQPKSGEVVKTAYTQTKFYKSSHEAKYQLKLLTGAVGGNAILDLQLDKKTFQDGNYKYTMYSYGGNIALVFKQVFVSNEDEQKKLMEEYTDCITAFEKREYKILSEQKEILNSQLETNDKGCFIIIAIFIVLMILLNLA